MISEASEALIKHCIMLTDTDVTHLKFISQILCQANSVSYISVAELHLH